jgi:hypothetical protein
MTQIRNEGAPFFNGRRTLTNTSSANFIIGRFDKRKGGISVYDYCSYNR